MIKPTLGRIVWFTPSKTQHSQMPKDQNGQCAAIVTCVWGDRCVNLCVFDANGNPNPMTSVMLIQDNDPIPGGGFYCEWMPYQVKQAEKERTDNVTPTKEDTPMDK